MNNFRMYGYKQLAAKFLLVLCWIFGLFAGYFFIIGHGDSISSLMHTAVNQRVTIVGLVLTLFFPLIISAMAVHLRSPLVLLVLVFLKAFCFSGCYFAVGIAFKGAGWLVRWLLLFSDSCMVVMLLWLWLEIIAGEVHTFKHSLITCVISAIIVGCIDYFVISPFLVTLF